MDFQAVENPLLDDGNLGFNNYNKLFSGEFTEQTPVCRTSLYVYLEGHFIFLKTE